MRCFFSILWDIEKHLRWLVCRKDPGGVFSTAHRTQSTFHLRRICTNARIFWKPFHFHRPSPCHPIRLLIVRKVNFLRNPEPQEANQHNKLQNITDKGFKQWQAWWRQCRGHRHRRLSGQMPSLFHRAWSKCWLWRYPHRKASWWHPWFASCLP